MAASPDPWEKFGEQLHELHRAIGQSRAKNVRGSAALDAARTVAQTFFRTVRQSLLDIRMHPRSVELFDVPLGKLLELSSTGGRRSLFVAQIRTLKDSYTTLGPHREMLIGTGGPQAMTVVTPIEKRIIETLTRLVPSAADSYQQALSDLGPASRHSWRGVAHELREALRETLDQLAPNAEVMAEPGFKLEGDQTKPTQAQKATHILKKRKLSKSASTAPTAVTTIETLCASLARSTYTRGSASAHSNATASEVRSMKMYVDAVLAELLEIHSDKSSAG